MNAKTALEKARTRASELEQDRQKREMAAAREKRKKERQEKREFLQKLKTESYPYALEEIEKAVDRGGFSVRINYGRDPEKRNAVGKHFKSLGYKVEPIETYYDDDRGDPDSGEGRCEAHWEFAIKVSWGK